ncbi:MULTISPECIES: 2-keto-4-pentenoate hydratase [unclassified Rhodococcus (in: high G+C Gram-positive bacteria)]|uniref:2-keto-4-pentenoate hydratase n=1 Tax=unclassified Rhodococcus (in: high G+C Gram-positive bacteria) TaxID=192944 RepID=UPI00163A8AF8|nr:MULTISPECIES: 2-keto-4-pentenoate hydratase [unclassified Rhodococcus (in: high G+C Gram-positive bacteria)]MBC2643027.1 fumarylacetoacetate hydrolase family protein [Rhodococcus sp. 3A]MBC2892231.1 fumarylacetoacetate hydrolase family protein [Rhodococcus sp. 4CII]
MLSDAQRQSAARLLRNAEQDRAPIDPLTTVFPDIDVVDAYEIALLNIRARLAAGETVYGHKVGLSSEVMQKMMGVDEPDYGHLLSSMVHAEGTPIDTAQFCYPRIEVEIGYVLGETLPGEGCTDADVLAATEYIVPSIELIDSRITDWKIGLADTIADNASSAGVILGAGRVEPSNVDIGGISAMLFRGDEQIARGEASAVLGNPTKAVAWLARKVASFGVRLEAGHVILPGSCTRAIDARPGDVFRADFSDIGSVSVEFK